MRKMLHSIILHRLKPFETINKNSFYKIMKISNVQNLVLKIKILKPLISNVNYSKKILIFDFAEIDSRSSMYFTRSFSSDVQFK